MQWKRSTTWSERAATKAKAKWLARSLSPVRSPSAASADILGSEKSGPITRTHGTAAEAQAFKRACACFGLGRYLYNLEGGWVDLDNKKQPKSTPKLPDWALPKRRTTNGAQNGQAPQSHA